MQALLARKNQVPSLFQQAADLRAREIRGYKQDHALKAPVVLSARRDQRVRVLWALKF
jgi:hypothetical protein